MVDFAKLRSMTAADRAALDEKCRNDEIIAERNKRAELSKKSIDITLTEDAEIRSTLSGETIVTLKGINANGQATRATYFRPTYISQEAINNVTPTFVVGKKLTLLGYWKKHEWKDRQGKRMSAWTFQTMTIKADD